MTRINVVPVSELCDKHLLAEYRELPRVFTCARQPLPGEKFPTAYTLGAGHMKFFYDKLAFLYRRAKALYKEGRARGFNLNYHPAGLFKPFAYNGVWNDWEPTPEALELNRARIAERISQFRRPL